MGVYDANKKDFICNKRYYENLSEPEQEKLMDEIKKEFLQISIKLYGEKTI